MATVKESGGDYGTLRLAIESGEETSISIEGTFNDLPHETAAITWDHANCTVTCDSDAQWDPSKPRTGGSYHHALHVSSGSHCITISAGTASLQGIEVKQRSSTSSAECIRIAASITVNIEDCLIWTDNDTADQDGVYTYYLYSVTLNLTNCCIVDCYRAGLNWQKYGTGNLDTEFNINSCTIAFNGDEDSDDYSTGGVVAYVPSSGQTGTGGLDCYIYNTIFSVNNTYDFEAASHISNSTLTIDRSLYDQIRSQTGLTTTTTDSESGVNITDTTGLGVSYIYVEDDDTAPYDLRLIGTENSCEAVERHSDSSGPNSMTMPSTDIMGTTRTADYCVGFFEYGESAGETIQATAADGFDLSETLARSKIMQATINDGVDLGENLAGLGSLLASLTDGLTLSETLAAGASFTALASDGATLADTAAVNAIFGCTATDGLTLSEVLARAAIYPATVADGITLGETLAVTAVLLALANDGATLGETLAGDLAGILQATAADGLALSDSAAATAALLAAIADGFDLSEQVISVLTAIVAAADGLTAGDSVLGTVLAGVIQALATDGLTLADTTLICARLQAAAADGLSLAETLAAELSALAAAADGLTLTDAASTAQAATAADGLTLTDAAAVLVRFVVAAADGIELADSAGGTLNLTATAADGLQFAETVGAIMKFVALASDSLQLSDVSYWALASGEVSISFTVQKITVNFTVKKPGINFS